MATAQIPCVKHPTAPACLTARRALGGLPVLLAQLPHQRRHARVQAPRAVLLNLSVLSAVGRLAVRAAPGMMKVASKPGAMGR